MCDNAGHPSGSASEWVARGARECEACERVSLRRDDDEWPTAGAQRRRERDDRDDRDDRDESTLL